MDLLAIGALAGTFEVNAWAFGFLGLAYLLRLLGVRATSKHERLLFIFGILAIGTGISLWLIGKMHPLIAAATCVPFFHALLWIAPESTLYRAWRLGIGFAELILASSLTAELYLPLAIGFFSLIALLMISCTFLDHELRIYGREHEGLPDAFIRSSLLISFAVLLSSVFIFPVLPRQKSWTGFGSNSTTDIGYRESVNVSEWKSFSANQTGTPVLWFYSNDEREMAVHIYLGLVRGKVLDQFDGKNWKADLTRPPSSNPGERFSGKPRSSEKQIVFDAIRSSIDSDVLPVPYGTSFVIEQRGEQSILPKNLVTGEWIDPMSRGTNASYSFRLIPNDLRYLKEMNDPPRDVHLEVPKTFETDAMRKLEKRIFEGAETAQDKIRKIASYFSENGYSASTQVEGDFEVKTHLNPIQKFLFVKKEGHCELFASSAAVLLRMAGVPTRLVAGFRLTKGTHGGVLTIRNTDAHAWLEAWSKEKGWWPVDPTPRVFGGGSLLDKLRGPYDILSAYWYRYFVSASGQDSADAESLKAFGMDRLNSLRNAFIGTMKNYESPVLHAIAAVTVIILCVSAVLWWRYPWIFSIRWKVSEGPPLLRRERIRMERLLRSATRGQGKTKTPEEWILGEGTDRTVIFRKWKKIYEEARFGPRTSRYESSIGELGQLYQRFRHALSSRN